MNWLRWERLCRSKEVGGLNFRDLRDFNLAMLCKQAWRLVHNPNSLASRLLKAKYYPKSSFLEAKLSRRPSFTWRSILAAQAILKQGCKWRLGPGTDVKVWGERWIQNSEEGRITTPCPQGWENLRVSDLLLPGQTRLWNLSLIAQLFNAQDQAAITSTNLSNRSAEDTLYWEGERTGLFSVKSCYRILQPPGVPNDLYILYIIFCS